jgi:hypothetical protein
MPTASNAEFIVANLEFDTIKSNLKTYLSSQALFSDHDFEGSNMNVLLDVLSYNTYYNGMYLNHVASEMFIDSAQIRDSIYSHAKTLNYLPTSYRSSTAYVDIIITPGDSPHSINIPRLTKFTSTVGDNTYTFSTNSAVSVYSNNSYTASNVAIHEGELVTEFYSSNATSNTFYINNFDVDTTSLSVTVRTSNTDTTNSEWTRANTLYNVTGTSNVYFLQPAANGSYELVFGNDTFGRKLTDGNIVEASYRVASGNEADGANTFSISGSVSGYSTVAANVQIRSAGGQVFQSLDDIKFAAPRALTTQERAVTSNDYKTLVQNEFGDITDMIVYGGDEANPPQFGKVVMVASSNTYDTLPAFRKQEIINFINPKSPLTIEPVMQDPTFLRIEVKSNVTYNVNETTNNENSIQTIVEDTISTFDTDNLSKFNKTFRQSKLIEKINESDNSILSNELSTRMIKEINPVLNQGFTDTVSFFNSLKPDNPVTVAQGASLPYSEPAIESGLFTFNSTTGASFRDDGDGALQIIVANNSGLTVLNANVGSVDYGTGNVVFSNVTVNAIATGTTIKIYARSERADIVGKLNDIIEIKTDDTTINVNGIRE